MRSENVLASRTAQYAFLTSGPGFSLLSSCRQSGWKVKTFSKLSSHPPGIWGKGCVLKVETVPSM